MSTLPTNAFLLAGTMVLAVACGEPTGPGASVMYDLVSLIPPRPVGHVYVQQVEGCADRQSSIAGGTLEMRQDSTWIMEIDAWESGGGSGTGCAGTEVRSIDATYESVWRVDEGFVRMVIYGGNTAGYGTMNGSTLPDTIRIQSLDGYPGYQLRTPLHALNQAVFTRR